ncbi:MAG TPA: alpha/beta-hydrolase family protein [Patescibacteria group bacterium]|nr:alpha/beta-hydrolase family protein [Patescibacteria group bacterium]
MAKSTKAKKSKIVKYFDSYNFLGTVPGMIFVYLGFLPTLLPRGWILQGVLSGILFTIGYGIGLIVSHFIRRFSPNEKPAAKKQKIKKYTYLVLAGLYIIAVVVGYNWQEEVRKLVGQSPKYSYSIIGTIIVSVLLIAFILLVSRSIHSLYVWLKRLINKHIPRPVAYTAAWLVTALLVIGVLNGVIFSSAMGALNEAFSVRNGTTDAGIVQPTAPELSGSSHSLIPWSTLGRQGRNFIGRANTADTLSKFSHSPAMQPIRIYAGLDSASNTKERADLATADLKRAGGFNRKVIVVVTTTGTGWVDEEGVAPMEYMYNGDSAIVSMQYSFLPSWLSFLVDQQKAKDAGQELYNSVYNQLLNISAESRPKIVVFGESLGSYGGESAFSNLASFKASSNGVVWAGPPNFNVLRKTATAEREPGSPEILPIFQNGQNVRFAAKPADFNNPHKPWGSPRAVYLENPSDPIVWWSPSLLFHKPDWLNEPRGADVSTKTRWIPIITFWGVTGDMVFSTNAPDGHGHKYGKLPTDAWSYVAPPDGWTQQKTDALKVELSK